jgi:hypothetical protein
MRRWFTLCAALALCGVFLGGCAQTDYTNNVEQSDLLSALFETQDLNVGCTNGINRGGKTCQSGLNSEGGNIVAGDRALNADFSRASISQFETTVTEDLIRVEQTPGNACRWRSTFSGVLGSDGNFSGDEWMAYFGGGIAAHQFQTEVRVFGGQGSSGTWTMSPVLGTGLICNTATGVALPTAGGPAGDCGNGGSGKSNICHVPPGNPANQHTICVGKAAVCAHINNHELDSEGSCGAVAPPQTPGYKTVRISTLFQCPANGCNDGLPGDMVPPAPQTFTSQGDNIEGQWGQTESVTFGDALPGGRNFGYHVETIALDSSAGVQFGPNIRGMTERRNTDQYSTYVGVLGRFAEGWHRNATLNADGLAEFLSGAPMDLTFPVEGHDFVATVAGSLGDNGMFDVTLVQIKFDGATFVPTEALYGSFDRDLKKWIVGRENVDQSAGVQQLARFMVQNVDFEDHFLISGMIPELGLQIPVPYALQFSRDWFEARAYPEREDDRGLGSPRTLGR